MTILLKYHTIVIATQSYFLWTQGPKKYPRSPLGTAHKKEVLWRLQGKWPHTWATTIILLLFARLVDWKTTKSALNIEYDTISQPKCPIFKTKNVLWPYRPMIFAWLKVMLWWGLRHKCVSKARCVFKVSSTYHTLSMR